MNSAGGDRSARQCGLFFCLPEGNELYGRTRKLCLRLCVCV